MSQWTSNNAIHKDLSVVQGRVPVAIEGTVVAGEKPPSINITEETEEEFYKHCAVDGDFKAGPDLSLIKKMLDMVRDINDGLEEEDCSNKTVVISKSNTIIADFIPKSINTSTPMEQSPKKQEKAEIKDVPRKKRQRNIAVESILQAIAEGKKYPNVDITPDPVKLLKPNDFIARAEKTEASEDETQNDHTATTSIERACFKTVTTTEHSETVFATEVDPSKTLTRIEKPVKITAREDISPTVTKKVTGWFETITESPFPKKTPKVMLESTNSMFKRKNLPKKVEKVESTESPVPVSSSGQYKPSALANEYYQKYIEHSKFKESVKDDIWTRAEKKMKQIDEKRKRELAKALESPSASLSSVNESENTEDAQSPDDASIHSRSMEASPIVGITVTSYDAASTKDKRAKIDKCLEIICLPQHRHRLTGECIVCEVILKKPANCVPE